MSERTLILVNPKAREGEVGRRWAELRKGLPPEASGAEVVMTSEEDHGSRAVRQALKDGAARVIVVGGDGTVSEAVQGFFDEGGHPIHPEASLGMLPAGRGDDFFKMITGRRVLSAGETWAEGLKHLREGKALPADVGRVSWPGAASAVGARYFINVASFGFPGLVVHQVGQRHGRTALTYLSQSASALLKYKPVHARITLDDAPKPFFDGPLFSGFVLNGAYNAGGVCWSSEARIDDGLFHVLAVEPIKMSPLGLLSTARSLPALVSGHTAGAAGMHSATARKVEVRLTQAAHPLFEIDGDLTAPKGATSATFEILPGAIRVWR